jgi:hypothetical protein
MHSKAHTECFPICDLNANIIFNKYFRPHRNIVINHYRDGRSNSHKDSILCDSNCNSIGDDYRYSKPHFECFMLRKWNPNCIGNRHKESHKESFTVCDSNINTIPNNYTHFKPHRNIVINHDRDGQSKPH